MRFHSIIAIAKAVCLYNTNAAIEKLIYVGVFFFNGRSFFGTYFLVFVGCRDDAPQSDYTVTTAPVRTF